MRIAIISSPRSGNTLTRILLSKLLKCDSNAYHSQDDIEWSKIPDKYILQLHSLYNEELHNKLREHSFKIITICRNPCDIALSILIFARNEPKTSNWIDGLNGNETPIHDSLPNSLIFHNYIASDRLKSLLLLTLEWSKVNNVFLLKYEDYYRNKARIAKVISNIINITSSKIETCISENIGKFTLDSLKNNHISSGIPFSSSKYLNKVSYDLIYQTFQEYFKKFNYKRKTKNFLSSLEVEKNWYNYIQNSPEITLNIKNRFISYSQNYEDVILWRLFKNIRNGFYIDVGSNDPDEDSVTKCFYLNGWSGINIEPDHYYYNLNIAKRPRDKNLNIAIDDNISNKIFYRIKNTGLSTLSKKIAIKHKSRGLDVIEEIVKTNTLNNICDEHDVSKIHFLKIDVEGLEEKVIKSIDLKKYSPIVLIIESTIPLSKRPKFSSFDKYVKNNNYQFCYFDGLNRFYLNKNYLEYLKYFNTPPNVFDNFISYDTFKYNILYKNSIKLQNMQYDCISKLEHKLNNSNSRCSSINNSYLELESKYYKLEKTYELATTEFSKLEQNYLNIESLFKDKNQYASNLERKVVELEKKFYDANLSLSNLKRQFSSLSNSKSTLEQSFLKLENNYNNLENHYNEIKLYNYNLNKRNNDLVVRNATVESEFKKLEEKYKDLEFKYNENSKYCVNLTQEHKSLVQINLKSRSMISDLEDYIDYLKSGLDNSLRVLYTNECFLNIIRHYNTNLVNQIHNNNFIINQNNSHIVKLQNIINENHTNFTDLEQRYLDLEQKYSIIMSEINRLHHDIFNQQTSHCILYSRFFNLQDDLNYYKSCYARINNNLSKYPYFNNFIKLIQSLCKI